MTDRTETCTPRGHYVIVRYPIDCEPPPVMGQNGLMGVIVEMRQDADTAVATFWIPEDEAAAREVIERL